MKQTVLKVTALSFLILGLPLMFINRSEARGPRDQYRSASTRQAAQQEKTVEQSEKNIKVLNGMPDSQLIPTMKFFNASLGVACSFCHVNQDGHLNFASDDKEEKQTARSMIKMVLDLNKASFGGIPQISCFTCHRGQASPQGFPSLPLALRSPLPSSLSAAGASSGAGAAQRTPTGATPVLPSGDGILDKYTGAIGGQAAIDRIKNRVMKGTTTDSNGQTGAYEIDQTAPDKGYELFTTKRGITERAVNAAGGWEKNAQAVRDLDGQQLADLKVSLNLFRNLKLKDQYSRVRISGRDKIGDRDVYVVSAASAGNKRERLYFDAETGLLLRRIIYTPTIIGIIPEQTDFEDYRDVQGVRFPFIVRVSSVDGINPIVTRRFEEIRLNVPVDDSKFNKPAAPRSASR